MTEAAARSAGALAGTAPWEDPLWHKETVIYQLHVKCPGWVGIPVRGILDRVGEEEA